MPDARIRPELHGLMPGEIRDRSFALCVVGDRWQRIDRDRHAIAVGRRRRNRPPGPELRATEGNRSRSWPPPEMEGRRGEGGRKAAAFLIDEFRRLKLEPLFQGQFVQEIPAAEPGRIQGRNVGAVLRGADPASATSG